jgi:flavin reductase (DIM6/NTAB) family NADH-FMN oxidoreductase RutF
MKFRIKDKELKSYSSSKSKIQVMPSWTKYLLTTHPVEFITTIGEINGTLRTDVAPFATCLDTSYDPPYVQISCAIKQHVAHGEKPTNAKMNTYLNIRQNGLFIVNVPSIELLFEDTQGRWPSHLLDIVAEPFPRRKLKDKIALANLTKIIPFVLPKKHRIYPPMLQEGLAHLECEVIDLHRPHKSDHYNITGKVVGASYDSSLGTDLEEVRSNLTKKIWHHFGSKSYDPSKRLIASMQTFELDTKVSFHLEKKS